MLSFTKTMQTKAVVAVILPREHLPFIREWCLYHIELGWKVVLYDNTGSTGSTRKTSSFLNGVPQTRQVDKRGNAYGYYTKGLSDDAVSAALAGEVSDLDVRIYKWQPQDSSGRIVHGQVEAYVDFIQKFRDSVTWAAFIDADEYLFATPGIGWDQVLEILDDKKCHRLLLEGVEYECRWTPEGEPRSVRNLSSVGKQLAGQKNIARLNKIILADIHWGWRMADGNRFATANPWQLHFKHYKAKTRDVAIQINPPSESSYEIESIPVDPDSDITELRQAPAPNPISSENNFSNWSISDGLATYLQKNLRTLIPTATRIVELGPGRSTKILAKAFPSATIVTFEHNEDWLKRVQIYLKNIPNIDVRYAPLSAETKWYGIDEISLQSFDVLVVDGPPGMLAPCIRDGAIRLVTKLRKQAVVILNNTNRPDERASIKKWIALGYVIIKNNTEFCVLRNASGADHPIS